MTRIVLYMVVIVQDWACSGGKPEDQETGTFRPWPSIYRIINAVTRTPYADSAHAGHQQAQALARGLGSGHNADDLAFVHHSDAVG